MIVTNVQPANRMSIEPSSAESPPSKADESRAFLFLTVVLFPVLAVLTVAGFGFAVWLWQLYAGPPGG